MQQESEQVPRSTDSPIARVLFGNGVLAPPLMDHGYSKGSEKISRPAKGAPAPAQVLAEQPSKSVLWPE